MGGVSSSVLGPDAAPMVSLHLVCHLGTVQVVAELNPNLLKAIGGQWDLGIGRHAGMVPRVAPIVHTEGATPYCGMQSVVI